MIKMNGYKKNTVKDNTNEYAQFYSYNMLEPII